MAQTLSTASSSQAPVKSEPKPIQQQQGNRQLRPLSPGDRLQFSASFRSGHLNLSTISPVNEYGSFEFDRVLKRGRVLCKIKSRHAFKASWKAGYLVLRPNLLSVYKDEDEAKLLLSVTLTEVTAVAPVISSRPERNYTWRIFTPSKNYRFQSASEKEGEDWIGRIQAELHVDEEEEAIIAATHSVKAGNNASVQSDADDQQGIITASELSDVGETEQGILSSSPDLTRTLSPIGPSGKNLPFTQEYSGNEMTELSDFSDAPDNATRAQLQQRRKSTLSPCPPKSGGSASVGSATNLGDKSERTSSTATSGAAADPERVIFQGHLQCLQSKRGVRQWKRLWVVLRPISLALYKDAKEYCAVRIIPMSQVITAAEIDPISRSKNFCLQIITEDRPTYRFCAPDEESLAKWLGALKSIIVARNKAIESKKSNGVPTIVAPPPSSPPSSSLAPPPEHFQEQFQPLR
ncbi:hypothetical protein BGW36DRAFT_413141 [Talaromyces proteolyticus]|uniref:PH domain-containing protein n=1 Tax=Talaromyces proteolyticus TaxID=1131652 RepID=A0AAD4L6Y0_9EURO|nr:uncharacterized protein BGW36DRAFT_413141 [Talaromyces proteolyticus]KAH8705079.1 hypothetical protein BGW36DRAFT_413141 [Talaromyces proteolyticus]